MTKNNKGRGNHYSGGRRSRDTPTSRPSNNKGRKSSYKGNFHSAAGKARSVSPPQYNEKKSFDNLPFTSSKKGESFYSSFSSPAKVKYSSQFYNAETYTDDDDNQLPQDRHYSIFQNPDTHTKEEHDHDEAFIKQQMAAAGGVTYVATASGIASTLNPTEAILLGATGAGNVVRNKGWWGSINNIPQNLGRIATSPSYFYAKFLHNTADALDRGIVESNKRLLKTWLHEKSVSIKRDNEVKRNAIDALAKGSEDDGKIRQKLTQVSTKTKMAGHYINGSPSYLIGAAAGYISQSLKRDNKSRGIFHPQTKSMRKWMHQKAKSIHADNKIKRKAIEKFAKNPIGKDIIVTKISSAFLALGAAVHLPQTYMGWDMYQQSGDLNGHLLGAGGVAVSYGLIALHKMREIPRLKEAKETLKGVTTELWDNTLRHETIGHMARGEYGQQALFVGLPLVGIMGKGLAYMYESTHLHHWNTETFTSTPKKMAEFDPQGALDYVAKTDTATLVNNLGNLDYTDALTMSASAAMLASGAVFFKSGWDETKEDFGQIMKYGTRKYAKDPINTAFYDTAKGFEEKIDNSKSESLKDLWYLNIRPKVGSVLPEWLTQKPYQRIKQARIAEIAIIELSANKAIHIDPDEFLKGNMGQITYAFRKTEAQNQKTKIETEIQRDPDKQIHIDQDEVECPVHIKTDDLQEPSEPS